MLLTASQEVDKHDFLKLNFPENLDEDINSKQAGVSSCAAGTIKCHTLTLSHLVYSFSEDFQITSTK